MPNNLRTPSPSMRSSRMRSQSPQWTPNPLRHPSPMRSTNRSSSASRRIGVRKDSSSPSIVVRSSSRPNSRPFPKELLSSSMMAGINLTSDENKDNGVSERKNVNAGNKTHKQKINRYLGLSSSDDANNDAEDTNNVTMMSSQNDGFSPEMSSPTMRSVKKVEKVEKFEQVETFEKDEEIKRIEERKVEEVEVTTEQVTIKQESVSVSQKETREELTIITSTPIQTKKTTPSQGKEEQIAAIESKLSQLQNAVNQLEASNEEDCRDDMPSSSREIDNTNLTSSIKGQVADIQKLFAKLKDTVANKTDDNAPKMEKPAIASSPRHKSSPRHALSPRLAASPRKPTIASPRKPPVPGASPRNQSPTMAKSYENEENYMNFDGTKKENYMESLDNKESLSAIIARLQRAKLR